MRNLETKTSSTNMQLIWNNQITVIRTLCWTQKPVSTFRTNWNLKNSCVGLYTLLQWRKPTCICYFLQPNLSIPLKILNHKISESQTVLTNSVLNIYYQLTKFYIGRQQKTLLLTYNQSNINLLMHSGLHLDLRSLHWYTRVK